MIQHFHKSYKKYQAEITKFIEDFANSGEMLGNEKRNTIKLFELDGSTVNIKSFQVPNIFNQFAYKFLRKSKAQRSFEYAEKLLSLDIGTPQPVAYFEYYKGFLFNKSYYVSEHLDYDLTYRELINDLDYPDHENILRQFTRFTYKLHENNVHFLDHSPGNTLIKKVGDTYQFYLVDLNRMEFKSLSFEGRIKNFERLSKHKSMVKVMSDEYAKCIGKSYDEVFGMMWQLIQDYQQKFHKKRKMKKKLLFWRN